MLVREQDAGHSGSGCCGRLGEAHSDLGGAADFGASRAIMEAMGEVYRRLRADAPALAIDVVDPRNTLWLYPAVWRVSRRAGRSVPATLKSLVCAGASSAVVLDGEVLFYGWLPSSDIVVAAVIARLGAACAA